MTMQVKAVQSLLPGKLFERITPNQYVVHRLFANTLQEFKTKPQQVCSIHNSMHCFTLETSYERYVHPQAEIKNPYHYQNP
jgi:hypothetical protein